MAAIALITAVIRWRSRSTTDARIPVGHTVTLALGTIAVGVVVPLWTEPYDDAVSAGAGLRADLVAAALCVSVVVATALRHRATKVAATSGP